MEGRRARMAVSPFPLIAAWTENSAGTTISERARGLRARGKPRGRREEGRQIVGALVVDDRQNLVADLEARDTSRDDDFAAADDGGDDRVRRQGQILNGEANGF